MGFEIINNLKKEKGLTNAQIAQMSGVTLSTLDKITSGVNKNPKLDTLQAICKVLGCTLNDFMDTPQKSERSSLCSIEALKLAQDYDGLDEHGKRVVRLVTDEEKIRTTTELMTHHKQLELAAETPSEQKMPTPVFEDGLSTTIECLIRYVNRLNPGQQQMLLDQALRMIEPQKESSTASSLPKGDKRLQ